MFDDIAEKENMSFRKKRLLAVCETILAEDKKEAAKKLFDIEFDMLKSSEPKNFIGVQSYEIQFEKNYQSIVCSLSSHTNKDVGQMAVIEVYTLMEMLKKKEAHA